MQEYEHWTAEEDEVVRRLFVKLGAEKLAERMERTICSVRHRASRLGVKFPRVKWTEELKDTLRNRYPTDGPMVLSEEFNIPYWAVVAKARRLGIDSTRKTPPEDFEWTEDKIQILHERYIKEGGDIIAKELGLALVTIRRKAAELGLHTIAGHVRAGKIKADNATHCNIHYFDDWSPAGAYILGFCFADASVSKNLKELRICLASKDECVLDFISEKLNCNRKIYREEGRIHPKTGNREQPRSTLIIASTVLVQRLIALGLKPRKTYNDDSFPDVPEDVLPHFIRGYLDGDGTTSISSKDVCSVGFVGSVRFIRGLRNRLHLVADMEIKKVHVNKGIEVAWATVTWNSHTDIRKFFEFAYPDGYEFCLERKRANLVKWLSTPRHGRGFYRKGRRKPTSN